MDKYKVLHDLESLAEPSFKEYKTTDYIIRFLKNINIGIDKRLKTGCFGTINFNAKKTVAIRADIDALPINTEKTECRHLCGHHLHTTALLFTLYEIVNKKIKLNVNLRYIFQPAEEIVSGAKVIIGEGGLDGVDEIYGLHVDPDIELGVMGIKPGELMAGSNHFEVDFKGKSTHGAYPHLGNDLIVAAADFINMAQKIVSRKIDPLKEKLITFGKIEGGTAGNILSDRLKILGTFRYFDKELKSFLMDELKKCAESVSRFYDIKIDVDIKEGTPPVINDEILTNNIQKICDKNGIRYVSDIQKSMGGEDFSLYQERIPGLFVRLGIKESDEIIPLHNINFKVPDRVIDYAVNFWLVLLKNL
ncbi:M20 metallopeptidase family protein [Deferribacter abyssi]|uniref:M20 metallopeptidase family protein n=1 Tax=Deferribacter abyssi TaxID=213806 RepID=UPI003C205DF9